MTRPILGRSEFGCFFGLLRGVFADFFWAWWWVGKLRFLLGIFDKLGGWCGVFLWSKCGELCGKDGQLTCVKSGKKMRQVFRLYFQCPEGDDVGYESSGPGRVRDASNKSVAS
jgi:hypothetical protein